MYAKVFIEIKLSLLIAHSFSTPVFVDLVKRLLSFQKSEILAVEICFFVCALLF